METSGIEFSPAQLEPMRLIQCVDKNAAIQQATEALHAKLITAKAAGKPALLLVSGGSALDLLKTRVDEGSLPENLTICALDDRVYPDEERNTYKKITAEDSPYALIAQAKMHSAHFINTSRQEGEKNDLFDIGNRVNREIQAWIEGNPDGEIIATLGMGPDGHTAGIFPGRYAHPLLRKERMTGGETVPNYVQPELIPADVNEYARRISATPLLLTRAEGIALVTGENKREPLARVLSASDSDIDGLVDTIPAALWRKMPHITIFTDIH